MKSVPLNGTFLVPALSSSGLLTASSQSTLPSGQFSITTFNGSMTAMRRGVTLFR